MSLPPVSVLIVDDDPDICETFKDVLEDAGFSVVCAHDGREGLAALAKVRPSLILLDVNMPNMDGYEFLEAQRADPSLRGIATVVMTAGHLDLTLPQGSFVAKPISLRQLLALVSRYCASAHDP